MALLSFKLLNLFPPYSKVLFCQKKGTGSVFVLSFSGTKPSDSDLECLKNLTQLISLDLFESPITDVGLIYLKSLTQLNDLDLSMTKITDVGLEHLKGLTNLQELTLNGTKVSPEGVAKLQQFLPNTKIIYSPPPPTPPATAPVSTPVQSPNQ